MKYIKTFELVDYNKPEYDIEEYNGPVYLYSDKPLDKDNIDKGRIYLYNRADASDTSSEYIYQIKLKNPLYKSQSGSFGFYSFDDEEEKDYNHYSGYFFKDMLGDMQVRIVKPEDILSFRHIGGFVKYDKDKSKKLNIKLSEKTDSWLYKYISGSLLIPKLTSDIIDELKPFKSTEKIKVYKGIEEVQIKHQSKDNPPYKTGQNIISKFDYSTSWTTNILTARRFIDEYPSSTPFVVTMIVEPKDILVNVEMLPDRYYHTNQREIILLPGKYSYKIIWEGKIE